MSKVSHLYRRGNTLYFRLSVPDRYRSILKVSEFTQSLRTQNRNVAIPAAYRLASEAKQLFLYIDTLMIDYGEIDDNLLSEIIEAIEASEVAGKKKKSGDSLQTLMLKKKHDIQNQIKDERHLEELEAVRIKSKADAYDKLTSITIIGASTPQQAPITEKPIESKAPLLRATYDEFVKNRTVADKKKFVTFGNSRIHIINATLFKKARWYSFRLPKQKTKEVFNANNIYPSNPRRKIPYLHRA